MTPKNNPPSRVLPLNKNKPFTSSVFVVRGQISTSARLHETRYTGAFITSTDLCLNVFISLFYCFPLVFRLILVPTCSFI